MIVVTGALLLVLGVPVEAQQPKKLPPKILRARLARKTRNSRLSR